MKVFRISGRDLNVPVMRAAKLSLNESLPHKRKRRSMPPAIDRVVRASMKVFRISGRDLTLHGDARYAGVRLNESLPHKRKRPPRVFGSSELPKL